VTGYRGLSGASRAIYEEEQDMTTDFDDMDEFQDEPEQTKAGEQFAEAVKKAIEAVERLGEENPVLDGSLATQLDEANDNLLGDGVDDTLMGAAIKMQAEVDDGPSTQEICDIMTACLRDIEALFCELSEPEQEGCLELLCTWLESIEDAISGYCGGFAEQ
jgi:hypothetical protein